MFNFKLRSDFEQSKTTQNQNQKLSDTSVVLLEPKKIEINGYKFIISKMPCTVAQEVIFKLPTGLVPLISNFSQAEDMAFKMLSYCERIYDDGRSIPLISKEVIDNHVPDFKTLAMLENACLQYNYDFFANERLLDFLNKGLSHVESRASKILTDLLDRLSAQGMQPFGNSNTNTR